MIKCWKKILSILQLPFSFFIKVNVFIHTNLLGKWTVSKINMGEIFQKSNSFGFNLLMNIIFGSSECIFQDVSLFYNFCRFFNIPAIIRKIWAFKNSFGNFILYEIPLLFRRSLVLFHPYHSHPWFQPVTAKNVCKTT